jgi:ornithine carbamoyltransferase
VNVRHFLQLSDFSGDEIQHLFERTRWIKDKFKRYEPYRPLVDRTLAMVFEKHSTRTRVSFEAGMMQLGGHAINLATRDTQLGRGEPIEDVARVITRMVDIVMIRTFEQSIIERFAAHARVPVVNGLTDEYHPCQILGDVFTFVEQRGSIQGCTVAWVGDSNNVCNTWLQAAQLLDFRLPTARSSTSTSGNAPAAYRSSGRAIRWRSGRTARRRPRAARSSASMGRRHPDWTRRPPAGWRLPCSSSARTVPAFPS